MTWSDSSNLRWLGGIPAVKRDHPLARHTSFNIGGPADWFVEVADEKTLCALVSEANRRAIPTRVIGAGTNLLVADAGIAGLVVRCVTRGYAVEGNRIRAGAGLKMMRLARIAADANLAGIEFAIGVPGTVGGAVYQDAGCWGIELRTVLVEVGGCTPEGQSRRWKPSELGLGYRTSAFRDGALRGHVILEAVVDLHEGDGAGSRLEMARLTAERNRTQPIKSKNCGSVFKNPPGDSAGRLIDAAGLKGAREGGARISPQHANFIVNQDGATAADVRRLIEIAQATVRQRFGVDLEPEVELVGRW